MQGMMLRTSVTTDCRRPVTMRSLVVHSRNNVLLSPRTLTSEHCSHYAVSNHPPSCCFATEHSDILSSKYRR